MYKIFLSLLKFKSNQLQLQEVGLVVPKALWYP